MEAEAIRNDLKELHRRDFATFILGVFHELHGRQAYLDNWHIPAMAWHLEHGGNRVIISLPPRYLKSIVASVAYPAWLLGHDPSKRIICISYSEDLTEKNARQCRQVMQSQWYRTLFPNTHISADKNAVLQFETGARGCRFSTSVGGALTGFGGDVIIIDDPLKAEDAMSQAMRSSVNDWFDNTLLSRLNDKRKGKIVIVMQRLHQEDLVGHVLGKGSWSHLSLPAIAEQDEAIPIGEYDFHSRKVGEVLHAAREPMEVLQDQRVRMGSLRFSAQYQQNPLPPDGAVIKWNWFPRYDMAPAREPGDQLVQSWDTAYKETPSSDYSVCSTFLVKGNRYYLTHVLREKLDYPSLRKKVSEHALRHAADVVLIENRGSGMSLIDDLRRTGGTGEIAPIAIDTSKDKLTRMSSESAQIEAGQVLLPSNAAWLEEFRLEVLQFPHGHHDDQIDSLAQFLGWIKGKQPNFIADFGYGPATTAPRAGVPTPPPPPLVAPTPGPVLVRQPDGTYRRWRPDRG